VSTENVILTDTNPASNASHRDRIDTSADVLPSQPLDCTTPAPHLQWSGIFVSHGDAPPTLDGAGVPCADPLAGVCD
jgi:hypothetical protein